MSENARKVAIVIPVYNRREITLQGLRSLARIDEAGLDVRILFVVDGSTDGTYASIAQEFHDIVLV